MRVAAGALLVAAIVAAWLLRGRLDPQAVMALLAQLRGLGPAAFVGLYGVLSLLLVPTLPLNLGAGVL
ncbi:MAG TPA: sulfurtransferase, partial [Thermoanaerobaculia bacterium]|nr:sulfurtransferase [Thermoanaerobaculia bacterium]